MAGRRKSWESLTPKYRARLSRGGVTKSKYESGASLAKARGHAATPEHPREAARHPERYREYNRKREKFKGTPSPEDRAYELNSVRDAAYYNILGQLGDYIKFREPTVRANVYGGTSSESGEVPGMNLTQARWTAKADAEELRSRASDQFKRNPWFYH
jgi:hypothetical protein